ncbi:MAG: LepB GTPase-activating domain-containing protein [Tatlockia sp.]|nr:LepB GTPase-activating domain-containing protein [Tatlockia sp.]
MIPIQELTKISGKNGGKNQSQVDGFYKNEKGEEFFIKKPADKKELFTELFAGLLLTEFMDKETIDKTYFPSLICADLIQFEDKSYGLIQPKVAFTELYKVIQTGYRDGSDRDPFTEMLAGPSYYTELTKQGQYFGLSISLMFSLLLGDYSVHSGNVVILDDKSDESRQFGRIDWGAAFRYFAHEDNHKDILNPYEYQGLLNFKWFTKGYISNYNNIAGLFPSIAEKAQGLSLQLRDDLLKDIVKCALGKIPADLLDVETQTALAKYMFIPAFENAKFGPQGDYEELAESFCSTLTKRLTKISALEEKCKTNMYQSALPISPLSIDATLALPDQFEFLLTKINENKKLDFTSIDLSRLLKEFNHYVGILSKQTDVYNLWDRSSQASFNLFSSPIDKEAKRLVSERPLAAKYRESVLLEDLHHLNPDTLEKSNYIEPYKGLVEAYKKENKHQVLAWLKTESLLQNSYEIFKLIKQLKENADPSLISDLREALTSFTKAKEILNSEISSRNIQNTNVNLASPIYYDFSQEELHKLSASELYCICMDESRAINPSPLVANIIKNKILWAQIEFKFNRNQPNPDRELEWRKCFLNFENAKDEFNAAPYMHKKIESLERLKNAFEALPPFLQTDLDTSNILAKANCELHAWQKCFNAFTQACRTYSIGSMLNGFAEIIGEPIEFKSLQQAFNNLPKALQDQVRDNYINLENVSLYLDCLKDYQAQIENFGALQDAFNKLNFGYKQRFYKEFKAEEEKANPSDDLIKPKPRSRSAISLSDAVEKDPTLRRALINKDPEQFSVGLMRDLVLLHKFHKEETSEENDRLYGEEHNRSIGRFYEQALVIRLSTTLPSKAQAKSIINIAHKEFHHRHEGLRYFADFLLGLSCLIGVGLIIVAGRLCMSDSVFFSKAPTKRESDFIHNWMKDPDTLVDNNPNSGLFF